MPHMEMKLRDYSGRAVLVRVDHNPAALTDKLALTYSVVGLGVNYDGKELLVAADSVERITKYKLAPLVAAISNMVDALLDLSCNVVAGDQSVRTG